MSKLIYLNIQSLIPHKIELNWLINSARPDIICLSETHVTTDILESEKNIEGYKYFSAYASNRHTGGSMIYIKDHLKNKEIKNVVVDSNLWFVATEVIIEGKKFIIACLYHSPSSSDSQFIEELEEILPNLLVREGNFILIGDFNINMALDTYYSKKLTKTLKELGVYQQMKRFTRITKEGATIIDLIVTNSKDIEYDTLLTPKITDHVIIAVDLWKRTQSDPEEKISRDYKQFNELAYQLELIDKQWNSNLPTEELSQQLVANIENVLNKHAPLKKIKIKQEWANKQWWTQEIEEEIKQRDTLYKRAVITKSENDWNNYKQKRNYVVKKIQQQKQQYYWTKIDGAKEDSKEMWKVLKEITGDEIKSHQKDGVIFEGNLETNNQIISEKFNNYFINSITDITKNLPCNEKNHQVIIDKMDEVQCTLDNFKTVEFAQLKKIVKQMKSKQSSVEGINTRILKLSFEAVGNRFLDVINSSIADGKFPETWKTSTVIPIQKKKNSNLCEDFRPINMVPLYEKLLEIIVKNQLIEYIEENKLLSPYQAGFRKNNSCETALQNVLACWKTALQEGMVVGALFLDLRRAFETISRPLLIKKLEKLGIRGTAIEWIRSYLSARTQKTKYIKEESRLKETTVGVPQGTVMGPDLFIIFINDIVKSITKCNIQLFADDTLLYVMGKDINDLVKTLNEEMKNLVKWLNLNNLKLNIDKTKFMIIKTKRQEHIPPQDPIKIEGVQIEQVKEFKYLGVLIDEHLNFSNHATYVTGKIAKKVYALGRVRNCLSVWAKSLIYKTIIQPHLYYCPTVLFMLNNSEIERLQKRQNQALRVILNCNRRTHIKSMLGQVGILSVKQTIYLQTLLFIFKIVKGLLPETFQQYCVPVYNVHSKNTRNNDNFYITTVRRTFDEKSLFHNGLKLYNKLPRDVKHSTTLSEFRKKCRNHILETIPY